MPYNIWCDGCKAHIAMGVRYNAEKTKVGKYFTTPIHKFRMKCHLCDQHFEIQTDPKNLDYVILSGARRKEQRWDMAENEQIVTEEKSDIKRLAVDSMFNLEHQGFLTRIFPKRKFKTRFSKDTCVVNKHARFIDHQAESEFIYTRQTKLI